MKDDAAVLATMDDARMMERPHLWPHMVLPLKRWRDNTMDTGFLSSPAPPVVIHTGTIWGGADGGRIEYATSEEAVADGWRVD